MFVNSEFVYWSSRTNYLRTIVRARLPRKHWQDMDDVLQTALLIAWGGQAKVTTSTKQYLMGCMRIVASTWRRYDRLDLQGLTYDGTGIEGDTPESIAIEKFCGEWAQIEQAAITLSPASQIHLAYLKQSEYGAANHAMDCRTHKLKVDLRAAVLFPPIPH